MELTTIENWDARRVAELHVLFGKEWWSDDRTLKETRDVLRGSTTVVGLTRSPEGPLVAFTRAMSDGVFRATIYDVIVREDERGTGLGRELVERVLAHPVVRDVEQVELRARAEHHAFYALFGFEKVNGETTALRLTRTPIPATDGSPASR